MANSYTFNGPDALIHLNTTGSFSVLDLYSRWKDWLLISDNTKYYQAFRYVGGDPTVGADSLGITYFLMNGWRIDPVNVDHRLQVDGNLFTNEGDSPFYYDPNIASITVQIENKVSNLTDATVIESSLSLGLDYNGIFYLDPINGVSGSTHPVGTSVQPGNNITQAEIITELYGIHKYLLANDLTIKNGQNLDGHSWEGQVANVIINFESGSSAQNAFFHKMKLTGNLSNDAIYASNCYLNDLTGFTGLIQNCGLSSSLSPGHGTPLTFDGCFSTVPGSDSPILDFLNHDEEHLVNFRAYSGGIRYSNNINAGLISTVDFVAGKFNVDSSMVNGFVSVRGVGKINNTGATTTFETGSLIWNQGETTQEISDISSSLTVIGDDVTEISSSLVVIGDDIQNLVQVLKYLKLLLMIFKVKILKFGNYMVWIFQNHYLYHKQNVHSVQ